MIEATGGLGVGAGGRDRDTAGQGSKHTSGLVRVAGGRRQRQDIVLNCGRRRQVRVVSADGWIVGSDRRSAAAGRG